MSPPTSRQPTQSWTGCSGLVEEDGWEGKRVEKMLDMVGCGKETGGDLSLVEMDSVKYTLGHFHSLDLRG